MNVNAKQMNSIHVNHMDITTALSYFIQIKGIIVVRSPLTDALGIVWTNYVSKLTAYDDAYAQARKWMETAEIKELDDIRDNAQSAFLAALKAMLKSPNAAKQAAAKKLQFAREKYGLNPGDEYMKQTTDADQYIKEVEANPELMACLTTTGLDEWFTDLKAKNDAFLAKMNERTEAQAGYQTGIVRATRIEVEAAYADLVKLINALSIAEVPAGVDYGSAIDLLNAEIEHFRLILARKGGGSSSSGSSTGSGSTNNGGSGGSGSTDSGNGGGLTPDPSPSGEGENNGSGDSGSGGGTGTITPDNPDNPGGGSTGGDDNGGSGGGGGDVDPTGGGDL